MGVLAVGIVALGNEAVADVHGDVIAGLAAAVPGVEEQIARDAPRPVVVVAVGRILDADGAYLVPLQRNRSVRARKVRHETESKPMC